MGYIVRSLTGKRTWKVQYQTYKGGRRAKDIREIDYLRLGIHSRMDIEEVRNSIRRLNSEHELKRLQERRLAIGARLKEEDLKTNAFLPDSLRQEFEANFIDETTKKISHWRTAKKLIVEIALAPHDWEYYKIKWYSLFKKKGYSYDYVQKITLILNRWGKFVAYKQKSYFEPISMARGIEKQRIIDARPDTTKESLPLTPKLLEDIRGQLKEEQWAWLYISLWLGLRPSEIDSLKEPKNCRLEVDIFWVYQTKLSGIPSKDRWKPIPIKYKEQRDAFKLIENGGYKRPLNKTLKKLLNGQYTCYAGRKGFTDLMLEKGNSLEAVSSWLGHKNINRTWKFYKDKKKVLLE